MDKQAYAYGFITKCAEHGIPQDAAEQLLKTAQLMRLEKVTPEELNNGEEDPVQAKLRRNREKAIRRLHTVLGATAVGGLGTVGALMYLANKRGNMSFADTRDKLTKLIAEKADAIAKMKNEVSDAQKAWRKSFLTDRDFSIRDKYDELSRKLSDMQADKMKTEFRLRTLRPNMEFSEKDIPLTLGVGLSGALAGGTLGDLIGRLNVSANRDLGIDPFSVNVRRDPQSRRRKRKDDED